MQFSAVQNIFIVKTLLNSTFTNDLKKKNFFRKMFIVTEYAALTGKESILVACNYFFFVAVKQNRIFNM